MSPKDDVTIKINWHELRILGMWAERWAAQEPGTAKTVNAITLALEEQFPSRLPLTLARELGDMKEHFPDREVTGSIQPGQSKKVH